ncbi:MULTISPECIES: hypothetical protein [Streptomycetaceae]|uniref:hypothetical protein n=1 Tax=unclassified Streptomyces TaxID=2593676 RepID=UPI0033F8F6D0
MTRFLAMEEPLLHSLYYFYLRDLPPGQAEIIRSAYESWGDIQSRMPPRLHWQQRAAGRTRQWQDPEGYTLRGRGGAPLTCLHAVRMSAESIKGLRACHGLLVEAESEEGPLARALGEIAEHGQNVVDNFRRVLDILQIQAPARLLGSLRQAAPAGPATAISLDGTQEAEYETFCERMVRTLSAGDGFTYVMHRALYF